MNAKTILSLTVLGAVTAASAAVTTDNTLCRIEVASGTKSTIVAVPLKTIAGTGETIKLTDLVLTDNLVKDDYILHKGSNGWESWMVSEEGKWTSVAVSEDGVTAVSGPDTAMSRGDAFWLVRKDATKSFYLYGEVIDTKAADLTIGSGYTMMGNTALEPVAINSITFNGTPKTGDKIAIATTKGIGAKEYTYNGTEWTEATLALDANGVLRPTVTKTAATIPAGQGFWYISK